MKVLNLDKLAVKSQRELVLGGVAHVINDMTVENFIETTKAAEKIADAGMAEQISATIEMVLRSVPTLTNADLQGMSLENLRTIVSFVRGDDDVPGVESSEVAEVEEVAADGSVKK
jgi:hypothetical protein